MQLHSDIKYYLDNPSYFIIDHCNFSIACLRVTHYTTILQDFLLNLQHTITTVDSYANNT